MRAVFLTDASPAIGGGHVVRCLALADAMSARGWECRFAVLPKTLEAMPSLMTGRHGVHRIEDESIDAEFARIFTNGCDLWVIDRQKGTASDDHRFRQFADHIMVIDDRLDNQRDCDLLLCQSMGASPMQARSRIPEHCCLLLGPAFALVRPDFADRRDEALARRTAGTVARVLVSLGLTDPENITDVVLDGLAQVSRPLAIDALFGEAAPHLHGLQSKVSGSPHPVTIHTGLDGAAVAGLMSKADLAIGAPGTMSWERCTLALPSLLIVWADNQKGNADGLAAAGAAQVLGEWPDVTSKDVSVAIEALISSPKTMANMAAAASRVCDGSSLANTIAAIIDLLEERAPLGSGKPSGATRQA